MDISTAELAAPHAESNPLAFAAVACAVLAAAILIWFLAARPALVPAVKLVLLMGIGVLPIGAALAGNIVGYEKTQERQFCGSCHVMTPYVEDSNDRNSKTLASLHARSPWFGDRNCYTCHSDYGLFGTITTKIGGMKHVIHYYGTYRNMPLSESLHRIQLYKPFTNLPCLQCHSTETASFLAKKDHKSALDDLRARRISCASEGCHGPSHPFSKEKKTP